MKRHYENVTLSGSGSDAVVVAGGWVTRPVTWNGLGLNGSPFHHTTFRNNRGWALRQATVDMAPRFEEVAFSGNDRNGVGIQPSILQHHLPLDGTALRGGAFVIPDSLRTRKRITYRLEGNFRS